MATRSIRIGSKPNSAFSPRFRNGRPGLSGICDACKAAATKVCPKCHKEKPRTAFYVRNRVTGKLHSKCKECTDAASREYAAAHPDKVKLYDRTKSLRRRYGMEPADFEQRLKEQNGRCALCRGKESYGRSGHLHVDHDHETGRIRGLLCYRCNSALAQFGDNAEGIQKAIAYLNPVRFPRITKLSDLSLYRSGSADYYRNKQYVRLYGIGIPEFDSLLASQKGLCAICESSNPKGKGRFCLDHDHRTNRIRGALCYPCNSALATLGDTVEHLQKALKYVQSTTERENSA
jgi:Recombination endonuclease VII